MVIEWCFMSKGPVKQWITSSFTVSLRGNCGLWFSVCMEFIGLCPARYLVFWLVGGGKVTQKVTLLFGMPFPRVLCGLFGVREIRGLLKTLNVIVWS